MQQWQRDIMGRRYLEENGVRALLEVGEKHVSIDIHSPYFTSSTRIPANIYCGQALDEEVERQFESAVHFNKRIEKRKAWVAKQ